MKLEDILRQIDTEDIDGHRFSPSKFDYTTVLRGGRAVHPISWRKEYGDLKTDQARRMKELGKENQRLRRAISDLTADKPILQEAARETSEPRAAAALHRSCTARVPLADLFVTRGPPAHKRSDNGAEFIANAVQKWLGQIGVKTLYIAPGSP